MCLFLLQARERGSLFDCHSWGFCDWQTAGLWIPNPSFLRRANGPQGWQCLLSSGMAVGRPTCPRLPRTSLVLVLKVSHPQNLLSPGQSFVILRTCSYPTSRLPLPMIPFKILPGHLQVFVWTGYNFAKRIDPYRQVLYWTLGFYFLACHLYPVKFHQFCVEITYELLFMLGITSPHPKYNITNMYISHIFCFPPLWQLVILWVYQPCIKFCITGPLLCFPGEDVQQSSLSTKPSLWPHRSWTLFW